MFKGCVILITGSASGIGYETTRQFIEQGASVAGADHDEKALEEAGGKLGDRFVPKRCDVSVEGHIASLSELVQTRFGRLDVLVNNAGRGRFVVPEEMQEDDFHYYLYDKAGLSREEIKAVFGSVLPKIPCGRIGKPEDIANSILFLSSEKASYINGACVIIDGGYLRGPDWGI